MRKYSDLSSELRTLMEDFFPRSEREKELDLNSTSAYSPGGSDSKASACNAGDPGSIPGSGRSPGVRNGSQL